jgi:kynurenine formamidase
MDEKINVGVHSSIHEVSQSIFGEVPVYPGEPQQESKPYFTIGTAKVNVSQIPLGSHTCTHVDSPKLLFSEDETEDIHR